MSQNNLFSVYADLHSAPIGLCTLETFNRLKRRMPAQLPWFRYFTPCLESDAPICHLHRLSPRGSDAPLRSGNIALRVVGRMADLQLIAELFEYTYLCPDRQMLFVMFEASADYYPMARLRLQYVILQHGLDARVQPWCNNELEFIRLS